MSVRPILLQKDGAIFGTPGAYRALPPKMAGLYAGSEALEDVTYYTVNASGEAELKTVKAYPFYVDSIAGGLDVSGDGTLENPWRSVNYALTQLQQKLTCLNSTSCRICLVLRIKGTVDYVVKYNYENVFWGYNRFIIEPWEEYIYHTFEFTYLFNCIFKKTFVISGPPYSGGSGRYCYFRECYNSIFNECKIQYESTMSDYGTAAFLNCPHSIFYNCNIEIKNNGVSAVWGFWGNAGSIFYGTNSSVYGNSSELFGFTLNERSAFYSCGGYVYKLGSYGVGCGFYLNPAAIYSNCTGNSLNRTDCDI